jgi:hypothetical protein
LRFATFFFALRFATFFLAFLAAFFLPALFVAFRFVAALRLEAFLLDLFFVVAIIFSVSGTRG